MRCRVWEVRCAMRDVRCEVQVWTQVSERAWKAAIQVARRGTTRRTSPFAPSRAAIFLMQSNVPLYALFPTPVESTWRLTRTTSSGCTQSVAPQPAVRAVPMRERVSMLFWVGGLGRCCEKYPVSRAKKAGMRGLEQ